MTSGSFRTVEISSIQINRTDRQRRALTGLPELALSISQVGLINPPVIDQNYNLIAGERRLTACRDILGWTHIPVQSAGDLDPLTLHLIELEENVKRVDLPWQDQCRAMSQYHEMQAKLDPSWSAAKTAKVLGVKDAEVSNRRMVAKALDEGDPLVVNADKYSVAVGIATRKAARKRDSAATAVSSMINPDPNSTSAPEVEGLSEDEWGAVSDDAEILISTTSPLTPFLHCDFAEWAAAYAGPRFNFIHCDFPYGVNAQSHNQGAGSAFGTYEDGEDVYWQLLSTLELAMENVVDASAHMMFWFSMDFYELTRIRLSEMGWTVNPFPLIWHKSDNSGILPDPKRGPRRIYETAFLCSRSDRLIVQAVANTFAAPNLKNIHMSEKNPDMLAHFFRMFVDEHTRMLDPTMGSGNAVRVAEKMGAQVSLGLERDAEFFSRASEAYLGGLTNAEG